MTNESPSRLFSLEVFIAKFLRYGVFTAGFFMLVGWMMQIDFHHNTFAAFAEYHDVPLSTALNTAYVNQQWGLLIAYFGLGILIALPLSRVALTAVVFIYDRDYALAACAALVLFGLGLSFALGYAI